MYFGHYMSFTIEKEMVYVQYVFSMEEKMKSLAELNIQQLVQETLVQEKLIQEHVVGEKPQDISTNGTSHSNGLDENLHPIQTVSLQFGTFIDHAALSLLVSEQKIIKTWPTQNWTLLFVDQTERFAIFEADDSWLMSILDLHTGIWHEDTQGHMLYFSDDGNAIIDNFHSIIHPFPVAA